ncbi:acyl carrier protein [Aliikangiella maris]|uniref:Acyl carrier protein n=2 Tax=Aliikangiella maris TaxID=3162458 RepID=A0ABV2BRY0_9GAMM
MSSGVLDTIQNKPQSDRKEEIQRYLSSEFKKSLFMQENEEIPLHTSVFDLGLNSLGAEALKQTFESTLNCQIDTVDFFNHPTIAHLTERLYNELFNTPGSSSQLNQVQDETRETVSAMLNSMYQY